MKKIDMLTLSSRSDGSEADDGEAGRSQNPLGVEENDPGGDGRQQQHHQLQRLCQNDVGQTLRRAQTVSKSRLQTNHLVLDAIFRVCCDCIFEWLLSSAPSATSDVINTSITPTAYVWTVSFINKVQHHK